jgi:hypothetical protein
MTIGDLVKETVDALPVQEQRKALALVRKLRPRTAIRKPVSKSKSLVAEVDAAISEAAGIWKNRADLPKDSVTVSRSLRRRLMRRGGNA